MNAILGSPGSRFIYRNPLDLPRISFADIVANSADGVYVEQPEIARTFHRAPPAFHDDPDNVGLFQPFDRIEVTSPPVFTASLRNATLVGSRSVLSQEGFFINDLGHLTREEAEDFVRPLGGFDEIGSLVSLDGKGSFSHDMTGQTVMHLEGAVVLLTSAEAGNFGSFMYRDLVKLLNLQHIPQDWRFLIYMDNRIYGQFLELAGVPIERVIRHDLNTVYRIDQAIVPGLRNPFAMADPQTRSFHDRLRTQCDSGRHGRRLYISRHSANAGRTTGRVMLNEHALIERLRPLGFEIIEPEHLSATEQVAAFASASLIVGPSGSAMFNAVFCHPGTRLIDIESEPHWIYPHCCLFASAGLDYGIFEGQAENRDWSVHHKPWHVNIDALLQRIESFAPGQGSSPLPAVIPAANKAAGQSLWAVPALEGEYYRAVLERFHLAFNPATYLEIGVADGGTLALATCPAIGVDPDFRLQHTVMDNKPFCCLYRMTSDKFFESQNPGLIFGQAVDMVFLDGMHWFEFLLRDFINVEKHCRRNSIILIHDCIPTDEHIARRDPDDVRMSKLSAHPGWWAGDVWKMVAMIMKYRSDLKILSFNAVPTGLVAITNLDPASTILSEGYFDLVEEYRNQTLAVQGREYLDNLKIIDTQAYTSLESMSSMFWL